MGIELDCSDIIEIFKTHLKIDNSVKSIAHTFLNDRYANRIDFAPYFQRKYVWDSEKASYFIESILLGTEIPPIVLFDDGTKNEVIDVTTGNEQLTWTFQKKVAEQQLLWLDKKISLKDVLKYADDHREQSCE